MEVVDLLKATWFIAAGRDRDCWKLLDDNFPGLPRLPAVLDESCATNKRLTLLDLKVFLFRTAINRHGDDSSRFSNHSAQLPWTLNNKPTKGQREVWEAMLEHQNKLELSKEIKLSQALDEIRLSDGYSQSSKMHLLHTMRFLGSLATEPLDGQTSPQSLTAKENCLVPYLLGIRYAKALLQQLEWGESRRTTRESLFPPRPATSTAGSSEAAVIVPEDEEIIDEARSFIQGSWQHGGNHLDTTADLSFKTCNGSPTPVEQGEEQIGLLPTVGDQLEKQQPHRDTNNADMELLSYITSHLTLSAQLFFTPPFPTAAQLGTTLRPPFARGSAEEMEERTFTRARFLNNPRKAQKECTVKFHKAADGLYHLDVDFAQEGHIDYSLEKDFLFKRISLTTFRLHNLKCDLGFKSDGRNENSVLLTFLPETKQHVAFKEMLLRGSWDEDDERKAKLTLPNAVKRVEGPANGDDSS